MARFIFLLPFFLIHQSNGFRQMFMGHKLIGLPKTYVTVPNYWVTQPLDHFDQFNRKLWHQRYFKNEAYYNETSNTVLLLLSEGGIMQETWMLNGQWLEYAKKFNALCFQLEHRFYGFSLPTELILITQFKNLKLKNLKYLNSRQALGDIANFINYINKSYLNKPLKWILFGNGYAGSLAAWMRLKYPHLVYAAVASGAPVLTTVNYKNYYVSIANTLKSYTKSNCLDDVNRLYNDLKTLLCTFEGREALTKRFRSCSSFEGLTKNDLTTFFVLLASYYGISVQFNDVNYLFSSSGYESSPLDNLCGLTANIFAGDSIDRLTLLNSYILDQQNKTCLDIKYSSVVKQLSQHRWEEDAAAGTRQWLYQACSEFGLFSTTEDPESLFPGEIPISYYIDMCTNVFGYEFNEQQLHRAINATNLYYGGLDIDASKIIFVQGTLDPWYSLFINQSTNPLSPSLNINGSYHCSNAYPELRRDSNDLKMTRKIIGTMLDTILNYL